MISQTSWLAVLAAATLSEAHFVFSRIAHNGVWQPRQQFIRNRTAPWFEAPLAEDDGYRHWSFPTYLSDAPTSIRCGRDSLAYANDTAVLKVRPGDSLEFAATHVFPYMWDQPDKIQWEGCPDGKGLCIESDPWYTGIAHDGPVVMHLSRVPDGQDVHEYDGSGEWVKFHTTGVEIRHVPELLVYWLPYQGKRLIATLPKQTPAGQYLLRVDLIWPRSGATPREGPQLYPACAQIEVEGDGSTGKMPQGIKIPEDLSLTSEGMQYPRQWGNWTEILHNWTYPGGKLWDGEKMIEDRPFPAAASPAQLTG